MKVKHFFSRVICMYLLFLVALGTACSQQEPSNPHPTSTGVTLPTHIANLGSDSVSDPQVSFQPDQTWRSSAQNDLQMEVSGFSCLPYKDLIVYFFRMSAEFPHSNLVLKDPDRMSYDPADLHALQDYLQKVEKHIGKFGLQPLSDPPQTLAWLPGGIQCAMIVHLSNKRNVGIEVHSFDFHLTKQPENNTFRYPLVDTCLSNKVCYQPGAGSIHCIYEAPLLLEKNGIAFEGKVTPTDACPPTFHIPAGQRAELFVVVKDKQQAALVYQGYPSVLISASGQEERVSFPDLQSQIYLTNTNDFPCFSLQEETFVPQKKINEMCQ